MRPPETSYLSTCQAEMVYWCFLLTNGDIPHSRFSAQLHIRSIVCVCLCLGERGGGLGKGSRHCLIGWQGIVFPQKNFVVSPQTTSAESAWPSNVNLANNWMPCVQPWQIHHAHILQDNVSMCALFCILFCALFFVLLAMRVCVHYSSY